jgi:ATP-dependent Clp protease protease subunit
VTDESKAPAFGETSEPNMRHFGEACEPNIRHFGEACEPNIRHFNDRARRALYEQRVLVLDGVLDDDNGTLLATQLIALATEDASAEIALWIHSPGGSVPSMLAIRDIMRLVPCDVSTLALGVAYSAGQFLLSAGTRGKRRAMPHSRILMHQGSAGIAGTAVDIELQANDLRHTRDTVLRLIAEDTGQPVDRVFEDSLHDRWYTAQEALAYGFIDGIVQTFEEIAPRTDRHFGLGVPAEGPSR